MARLDPVKLLSLLLQLALELILLELYSTSLCSRPADPAFQLYNARLEGRHGHSHEDPSCQSLRPSGEQDKGRGGGWKITRRTQGQGDLLKYLRWTLARGSQ